ncbi:MAG TPA: hypothetical protein DCE44_05460, partial [Verrucomicrobiales bacterium]|nr:hypothetical protein [Verrucomicrobiales bacterium]
MLKSFVFVLVRGWIVLQVALSGTWVPVRAAEIPLAASPPDVRGWIGLQSPGKSNTVHVIEASINLMDWHEAAVLHDGPFTFRDVTAPAERARFFRLQSRPKTANDTGKNQVNLPDDPFANEPREFFTFGEAKVRWIKFAILRADETRVWFQDSAR